MNITNKSIFAPPRIVEAWMGNESILKSVFMNRRIIILNHFQVYHQDPRYVRLRLRILKTIKSNLSKT